ncbi:hypothetical protein BC829DRAFT_435810 [Chytridium lagenaria]|nr:hypothetical protein BC829DRAFT_435810 [Chytridium lagenaria]
MSYLEGYPKLYPYRSEKLIQAETTLKLIEYVLGYAPRIFFSEEESSEEIQISLNDRSSQAFGSDIVALSQLYVPIPRPQHDGEGQNSPNTAIGFDTWLLIKLLQALCSRALTSLASLTTKTFTLLAKITCGTRSSHSLERLGSDLIDLLEGCQNESLRTEALSYPLSFQILKSEKEANLVKYDKGQTAEAYENLFQLHVSDSVQLRLSILQLYRTLATLISQSEYPTFLGYRIWSMSLKGFKLALGKDIALTKALIEIWVLLSREFPEFHNHISLKSS